MNPRRYPGQKTGHETFCKIFTVLAQRMSIREKNEEANERAAMRSISHRVGKNKAAKFN